MSRYHMPAWYPCGPAGPELLAAAAGRLLHTAATDAMQAARTDHDYRFAENLGVTANAISVTLGQAPR